MKKNRKRAKKGEPQLVTRAITHIRLEEANAGKLSALSELASPYMALTQAYVTLFCTKERPNSYRAQFFPTLLSARWHRVAIQQAAGIAKSWRSNRANAYEDYVDAVAEYHDRSASGELSEGEQAPEWREWDVPVLRQTCVQANCNVVQLEGSTESGFDYWLKISTLEPGKPLLVPVKLAEYHKQELQDPSSGERRRVNSSVTLNQWDGVWWLTLSYDEVVEVHTKADAPVIGIDVGIANFVTTSDGKQYGAFDRRLRERHRRERAKQQRKAKLIACLKKKGVPEEKLPKKSTASGQRLSRHVRQSINKAVKDCLKEHAGAQFAYERLNVASMKFKTRSMNAYLYASNLGHIPLQIEWNATKRGVLATKVKSAYSSQECHHCHYVDRKNRPNQETFSCKVCGHTCHADVNAAQNVADRLHDEEPRACKDRKAIKALLLRRHEQWKKHKGWP
jgi:hypothetical protein